MNRSQHLEQLARETFDLCIIGGGASGAGCALDATLRGLKVALIEKDDFAAETSSRSTKLVHGGVRYLEQAFRKFDFAQLKQVVHGLRERRIVLQNAPHLARPLGLLTPVFSTGEALYYSIGLKLYDWFAGRKSGLPGSRRLDKAEALRSMPGLSPAIKGAVLYYDGQLDDARYALAIVQTAAEAGATAANHLEAIGFQRDENGELRTLLVQDRLNGSAPFGVKARCFLNCTGPFADKIRSMANPALPPRLRPSKGVHLVLPADVLGAEFALLIPKTRDGRMVFALPFEGKTLLGTTDEPYETIEQEPLLEGREVRFLLETLQPFVKETPTGDQVSAGFGGIRPLVKSLAGAAASTKALLRDHEVELDPVSGLISLLGGKWTTYRLMARDATDAVCRRLDWQSGATADATASCRLTGAEGYSADLWKKLAETSGLDADICRHLAAKYGGRALKVLDLAREEPASRERIHAGWPFIAAEIKYAARFEMTLTLRDFLARRTRLEMLDWNAAIEAAPVVAAWLGRELQWDAEKVSQMTQEYQALVELYKKAAREA
jgi:glycerol-3-phosphate dehydrogenase